MNKYIVIIILIVFLASLYIFSQRADNVQNNNENKEMNTNNLKIETLKEGTGQEAKNNDVLTVHYTGYLENGTKFDSSLDRQVPFSFTLGTGQVIKGWDMGVLGMKLGEVRKLTIPSLLGYGSAAVGPIPPNSNLIFEIELLGINQ